jgi:hypothetical protein
MRYQLHRTLIKTHWRMLRVIGFSVRIQDILHAPHEVSADGGDTPLGFAPGLQLIFFSVRRTVSSEIGSSTACNSSNLSARICIVQYGDLQITFTARCFSTA